MIILTFQTKKQRLRRLNSIIKISKLVIELILTKVGLVPKLYAIFLPHRVA